MPRKAPNPRNTTPTPIPTPTPTFAPSDKPSDEVPVELPVCVGEVLVDAPVCTRAAPKNVNLGVSVVVVMIATCKSVDTLWMSEIKVTF